MQAAGTETFPAPVLKASRLRFEKLQALYSSLNIIRVNTSIKNKMGWACSTYGRRGAYRVLVGRLVTTRPFGSPRHRWEDNIKMDLQELREGGMDWIDMVQDRDRWRAIASAVQTFWVR